MIPNYSKYYERTERSDFIFTDLSATFREVPANEIFEIWDETSDLLKQALRYSPEEICTGDVYMKLMLDETCRLYILEENNTIVGSIVCYIVNGRKKSDLRVWLIGGKPKWFSDIGKVVYNIAKRNKCSNITASSTRKAMQKALSSFGFVEQLISYEMRIK